MRLDMKVMMDDFGSAFDGQLDYQSPIWMLISVVIHLEIRNCLLRPALLHGLGDAIDQPYTGSFAITTFDLTSPPA